MAAGLYIFTILTTLLCAGMLLHAYGKVRRKLLLWSGLCFIGLTVNNILTYIDLIINPMLDQYTYRLAAAAISMTILLYGLIWESQ